MFREQMAEAASIANRRETPMTQTAREKKSDPQVAPNPVNGVFPSLVCVQAPITPPSFLVMTMVAERGRWPAP
jgi:hypothetical protein